MEVRFLINGKIQRRISFVPQGREYVVYEQEASYSLNGTSTVIWNNTYINTFTNREYAKTAFLGLISKSAMEEGGVQNDELERYQKKMYTSLTSPVGRL